MQEEIVRLQNKEYSVAVVLMEDKHTLAWEKSNHQIEMDKN